MYAPEAPYVGKNFLLFCNLSHKRHGYLLKFVGSGQTHHKKHRKASLKYLDNKYLSLALFLGGRRRIRNPPELVFVENFIVHVPELPRNFSVYVKNPVKTMKFSFKIVRERIQLSRLRPNPLFSVDFAIDVGSGTFNLPVAESVAVPMLLSVAISCDYLVMAEFAHKVVLLPSLHFLMADFAICRNGQQLFCGLHFAVKEKFKNVLGGRRFVQRK